MNSANGTSASTPAVSDLLSADREPIGAWSAEPIPGGRWSRVLVVRAGEWAPAVLAGREEETARVVAVLDLDTVLFPDLRVSEARRALWLLVDQGALDLADPLTAEMRV
jgi:hypothetical protein